MTFLANLQCTREIECRTWREERGEFNGYSGSYRWEFLALYLSCNTLVWFRLVSAKHTRVSWKQNQLTVPTANYKHLNQATWILWIRFGATFWRTIQFCLLPDYATYYTISLAQSLSNSQQTTWDSFSHHFKWFKRPRLIETAAEKKQLVLVLNSFRILPKTKSVE